MMNRNLKRPDRYDILKIIAIYAIFSCLWIYFSDTAIGLFITDPTTLINISVFKGILFVIITSILLYQLVSRYLLESRQLKDAIKKNDLLFSLLREGMMDAFCSIDMTGKILQYNEGYRIMLGYEAEELLSKTYLDITPEKWHSIERKIIEEQVVIRGYSEIYEKEYIRKDGTVFPVELRTQLIRDDQGNPQVMWAIIRDITERKLAEEGLADKRHQLEELNHSLEKRVELAIFELRQKDQVLYQQSRLAAMGEMISNIAHQWRQPLNTLGLTIQQLPLFYDTGHFNREFLDKSVSDAMVLIHHMSDTIDDFRSFFKPDKEKKEFKVSQVVSNAIQLVKASFDSNQIKIVVNYTDDPVVHGYQNEYTQVILNILNNAKDAFMARNTNHPQVIIITGSKEGRSVVTISDNAGGIPAEMISKVFDPHFSTKGPQGTGIGLFMAQNIIERSMNGRLSVRNKETGAEFRIEV